MEPHQYHHPVHQDTYSAQAVRGQDGEASYLFGLITDLIYPESDLRVTPAQEMESAGGYTADYRFSFVPDDAIVSPAIQERVDVSIRHAEFIGITSLSQFLDVSVSHVISTRGRQNEVLRNDCFIEQRVGNPDEYSAMVRRMDVTGGQSKYEPMTVYDSELLYETIQQLRSAVYVRRSGIRT